MLPCKQTTPKLESRPWYAELPAPCREGFQQFLAASCRYFTLPVEQLMELNQHINSNN